jgi:hypothetical protein
MNLTNRNLVDRRARRLASQTQRTARRSIPTVRRRSRSHDPMLVLNMSIFNSGSSWNRIFNPAPQRENAWGAHCLPACVRAPRVLVPVRLGLSVPSPKSSFHLAANQSSS